MRSITYPRHVRPLPIYVYVRERCAELGWRRSTLAQELGFRNITKGLRAIDAMCEGDFSNTVVIDALRACVALRGIHFELAFEQSKQRIAIDDDEQQRSDFTKSVLNHIPHLWFEHERRIPSPVHVVACMGGPSTFKRLELPDVVLAVKDDADRLEAVQQYVASLDLESEDMMPYIHGPFGRATQVLYWESFEHAHIVALPGSCREAAGKDDAES